METFSTLLNLSKNTFSFCKYRKIQKEKMIFADKKGLNPYFMDSTPLFANTMLYDVFYLYFLYLNNCQLKTESDIDSEITTKIFAFIKIAVINKTIIMKINMV